MYYIRAIVSGIIIWICISLSFYVLEKIPIIKHSFQLQSAITVFLSVFFALRAAKFYYAKNYKMNGLKLGIIMSVTALLLDVLITVPLVEIPNGRSYESFFTSPVLWGLVFVNTFSVYFWEKYENKSEA